MKNLIYFIINLALIYFLSSCDKIKKDAEPELPKALALRTKVNTPIVVDLLRPHNITGQAQVSLIGNLSYGRSSFVNNAGIMMYTPNNSVSNVTENINYQICQNNNCQSYNMSVQITNTPSTTPVDNAYCEQYGAVADTYIAQVSYNRYYFHVIFNDSLLCSNYINRSSLELVTQPLRGTAEVEFGMIKYTFNSLAPPIASDVFIYRISSIGNPNIWSYAAVTINFTDFCPIMAYNDDYLISQNVENIPIFFNDFFCLDSLATNTAEAFQIIQQPAHGTITWDSFFNPTSVKYTKNANYIGQDSFVYQLKYRNGYTSQATVSLTVYQCNTLLVSDTFTYANNQISNSTVDLDVLTNDSLCGNEVLSLPIAMVGNISLSVQNNKIRCVLPAPNYTGNIVFSYNVLVNGTTYTTSVVLNITN